MPPPHRASMLRPPTCRCAPSQVFPAAKLYTPDNLRADNNATATASLRDIVLPGGSGAWPTVGALRGKVLFFADPDYTAELESVCASPATDPSPSPALLAAPTAVIQERFVRNSGNTVCHVVCSLHLSHMHAVPASSITPGIMRAAADQRCMLRSAYGARLTPDVCGYCLPCARMHAYPGGMGC